MVDNPSLTALYGPLPSATAAGIGVLKTVMMGSLFTAFLAFAIVRRHTRTEEEDGRFELLAAGVVGRRAPLAAAVALATPTVLATGLLSALSLVGTGVDATGSFALGAVEVVAGLVMTGITAIAVQLTSTTRGAGGIAIGALGLAFIVRAAADTSTGGAVTSPGSRSSAGPRRSARSARTGCGCSCLRSPPPWSSSCRRPPAAPARPRLRSVGRATRTRARLRRPWQSARPRVAPPARLAAGLDHRVCRRGPRRGQHRQVRGPDRQQPRCRGDAAQDEWRAGHPARRVLRHRAAVPRDRGGWLRHRDGVAAALRGERRTRRDRAGDTGEPVAVARQPRARSPHWDRCGCSWSWESAPGCRPARSAAPGWATCCPPRSPPRPRCWSAWPSRSCSSGCCLGGRPSRGACSRCSSCWASSAPC